MRVRARMLSAESIPTIVFSSSMSFVERLTHRLTMPLVERTRDYLESSVRVGLYPPRPFLPISHRSRQCLLP